MERAASRTSARSLVPKRIARTRPRGMRAVSSSSSAQVMTALPGPHEQRGFFVRHAFERAEALGVLDFGVQDHRDVRLHDSGQTHDFARRVGAAFDDHRSMRLVQLQQG